MRGWNSFTWAPGMTFPHNYKAYRLFSLSILDFNKGNPMSHEKWPPCIPYFNTLHKHGYPIILLVHETIIIY